MSVGSRHRRRERGSSLMETTAALALIGLATMMAASLLVAEPRAQARLDAQRDLLRAVEATLESVRAGALPLADAELAPPVATATPLRVRLEVRPRPEAGLFEVRATARARVRGRPVTRTLSTLVWRPS